MPSQPGSATTPGDASDGKAGLVRRVTGHFQAYRDVPILSPWKRQAAFLLVLVVAAASLVVIAANRPFLGCVALGASLILAGVMRAVLTTRRAGLLVVRSRVFDVFFFMGAGLAVIVVSGSLSHAYSG